MIGKLSKTVLCILNLDLFKNWLKKWFCLNPRYFFCLIAVSATLMLFCLKFIRYTKQS